jgi:hypothetical protein
MKGKRITAPKSTKVLSAARREAMRRLAGRVVAQGRADLSWVNADDITLGTNGSKWRHGYIPLNAAAVSLKTKKTHGHGGGSRVVKGRTDVKSLPSGKGRSKTRPRVPGKSDAAMTPNEKHRATNPVSPEFRQKLAARAASSKAHAEASGVRQPYVNPHRDEIKKRMESYNRPTQAEVAKAAKKESSMRKSTLRATMNDGPPQNFESDAHAAAMKSGDLHKAARMAKALHGQGYNIHADTGAWVKDSPGDRPWVAHVKRNGDSMMILQPGSDPFAPPGTFPVQTVKGASIGHIRHQDGKLRIGNTHGRHPADDHPLPEHDVKNMREAVAGLHAAHTLSVKAEADRKAAHEASIAKAKADNIARDVAARKAVDDARREKDAKSAAYQRARDEKNRRDLAAIPKGTKPTVTKSDTAAKAKLRDALNARLGAQPVDAHHTDVKTMHPGQAVTFTEHKGRGVASETHVGHVVHVDSGQVHVSTGTHTFTAHTERGNKVGHFTRRDPAADKKMIADHIAAHNASTAMVRESAAQQAANYPQTQKPIPNAAHIAAQVAAIKARSAAKRAAEGKPPAHGPNYVGMTHEELQSRVRKGEHGAVAENERRGKNAVRRSRLKA